MSRLIDEDKLLQDISNTINDWIKEIPDGEYLKGNVNFAEMAKEIVRNQPTAFNVDKVARQIEDLKEENFKRGIKENEPALLYASSCLHKAIEIVKRGGVDE